MNFSPRFFFAQIVPLNLCLKMELQVEAYISGVKDTVSIILWDFASNLVCDYLQLQNLKVSRIKRFRFFHVHPVMWDPCYFLPFCEKEIEVIRCGITFSFYIWRTQFYKVVGHNTCHLWIEVKQNHDLIKWGYSLLLPKTIYQVRRLQFQLVKKGLIHEDLRLVLENWCAEVGIPLLNANFARWFVSNKKQKILKKSIDYYFVKDQGNLLNNMIPKSNFGLFE